MGGGEETVDCEREESIVGELEAVVELCCFSIGVELIGGKSK